MNGFFKNWGKTNDANVRHTFPLTKRQTGRYKTRKRWKLGSLLVIRVDELPSSLTMVSMTATLMATTSKCTQGSETAKPSNPRHHFHLRRRVSLVVDWAARSLNCLPSQLSYKNVNGNCCDYAIEVKSSPIWGLVLGNVIQENPVRFGDCFKTT